LNTDELYRACFSNLKYDYRMKNMIPPTG